MRYLTKSRFKLAVECPTKLFYTGKPDQYRDAMADNDFLAMLAEGGYQVGELAKQRYPGGIEIFAKDHTSSVQETNQYLKRDKVVLFEPAIQVGDFFIRIDILVKNGQEFELIEVKAKSYNSEKPEIEGARGIKSGMLPYIQDAAFQTWVLRQAYPKANVSTWLMMPDKARLAPVDGINQIFKLSDRSRVEIRANPGIDLKALGDLLLAKVPIDAYVAQVLSKPFAYPGGVGCLEDLAKTWANAYKEDQRIPPVIGAQCGGCQFKTNVDDNLKSGFHECWKEANHWTDTDFAQGTVLDLWNYRKKQELIDRGILKISQVQREDIGDFEDDPDITGLTRSQRQWQQVGGIHPDYDYGGFYFNAALFQNVRSRWKYPLHLIDFETASVALPFYKDMRPYEAVAFQYSHHVMEADGNVRHVGQFLGVEPGHFPNFDFARSLMLELNQDEGSVFMWSQHENTILSTIRKQLNEMPNAPEDAQKISKFLGQLVKGGDREMIDLCALAEKAYFHPDTTGSNSIKKVLPSIIKASEFLQQTYVLPVYGSPGGIQSLNYGGKQGFQWLEQSSSGLFIDPYAKLKQYAKDLMPEDKFTAEERIGLIAEGGAASTAYVRLQFEDMSTETRERIKKALLRYCELDTLAMVMIMQGWNKL